MADIRGLRGGGCSRKAAPAPPRRCNPAGCAPGRMDVTRPAAGNDVAWIRGGMGVRAGVYLAFVANQVERGP